MRIGVSGAGGHVGAATLADLRQRAPQHELVAITRAPEKIAKPIEARFGDYDQPETLLAAYAGLDRLLIIPSADLRPGMRSAQALASVDAAVAAKVKHVFLLSATGTRKKNEPAMGAAYWVAEERLLRSDVGAWTILRMNFFAETMIDDAKRHVDQGAMVGLSENRCAYVARDDVAAACAGALATEGHIGAIYNLTGPESVSSTERAALIAAASGKPMGYLVFAEEQYRAGLASAGLPPPVIDVITSMQASFADGAYDIVTGDIEKLSGRSPKPLRDILAGAFA